MLLLLPQPIGQLLQVIWDSIVSLIVAPAGQAFFNDGQSLIGPLFCRYASDNLIRKPNHPKPESQDDYCQIDTATVFQ